jgi:hypothetical protein
VLIVGAGCSRICAAKKHNADLPKQPIAWHVTFKNGDGILARWLSGYAGWIVELVTALRHASQPAVFLGYVEVETMCKRRCASSPEVEGDAASMGTVKIDLSIALAA